MRRWFNKDVGGALLAILLILAISAWITGCAHSLSAEFEHHSSIPDYHDRATTDHAGLCLTLQHRGKYKPEMDICVHQELDGHSTYGHKPTGTVRLRAPIWERK